MQASSAGSLSLNGDSAGPPPLEAEFLNRGIARATSHGADPERALGRAVRESISALTKLSRWESRLDRALSRHS